MLSQFDVRCCVRLTEKARVDRALSSSFDTRTCQKSKYPDMTSVFYVLCCVMHGADEGHRCRLPMSQVSKRQPNPLEMQIISTFLIRKLGATSVRRMKTFQTLVHRRPFAGRGAFATRFRVVRFSFLLPMLESANHSST